MVDTVIRLWSRLPPWAVRIAGLVLALLLTWLTCPRPGDAPPAKLVLQACLCLGLTTGVGILFRVVSVSAWFPLFFYFLFEDSLWNLGVTAVIAASAVRLFQGTPVDITPPQEVRELFTIGDGSLWTWRLAGSLFAASCFLAATLLAASERGNAAQLAVAGGTGIVTWYWTSLRKPRHHWQAPLTAAILLLVLWPVRSGGGDSAKLELPGTHAGQKDVGETAEVHSGIILAPEEQAHTILVPPLPAMPSNLFAKAQHDPLSIPFYGVYWLFQPPHKRPPPKSLHLRGDPVQSSFRATGRLIMEARQNFGKLIAARCCSGIRVAIRNGDRYPKSVKVELLLANTAEAAEPRSLGAVDVKSILSWQQIFGNAGPSTEILDFTIPPGIGSFDEIAVRFHLGLARSRYSPKIAIDRFIFVPAN